MREMRGIVQEGRRVTCEKKIDGNVPFPDDPSDLTDDDVYDP
jgi:hypothetical protein